LRTGLFLRTDDGAASWLGVNLFGGRGAGELEYQSWHVPPEAIALVLLPTSVPWEVHA
jgi:hypothetical protein